MGPSRGWPGLDRRSVLVSNVVDIASFRSRAPKAEEPSEQVVTEKVRIIACSRCSHCSFELTHDGRVVCAGCKFQVEPLRWFDETKL